EARSRLARLPPQRHRLRPRYRVLLPPRRNLVAPQLDQPTVLPRIRSLREAVTHEKPIPNHPIGPRLREAQFAFPRVYRPPLRGGTFGLGYLGLRFAPPKATFRSRLWRW